MAGVLPPWHDGCHGSRVWRGKPPVEQERPPFGDGPHGSQQGVTPCTPHRAHRARGTREKASWPGFYRRGTTGATARGSGVVNRQLNRKGRHSATGLMARSRGCPPAPHTAPVGRGALERYAGWLRSYRRSATGLEARRSGRAKTLHPSLRWRAGA